MLPPGTVRAQESPSDREEIVHVLNRISFGPRPGDVEAVEKMGLHNYIERQLHPETIDDSAVEQQVAGFDLLQMSPQELSQMFQEERKNGLKKQKQLAAAAAANGTQGEQPARGPGQDAMQTQNQAPTQNQGQNQIEPAPQLAGGGLANMVERAKQYRTVAAIGELEQAKLVRAVDSERQLLGQSLQRRHEERPRPGFESRR